MQTYTKYEKICKNHPPPPVVFVPPTLSPQMDLPFYIFCIFLHMFTYFLHIFYIF